MMTIDEMLAQVADIAGAAPKNTPVKQGIESAVKGERAESVERAEPQTSVHEERAVINTVKSNGVIMRPTVNLSLAKEIACCIKRAADMMQLSVVIAVADAGGKLILLEAMDNSYIASVQAAQDKAYTAVALKMPTHEALKESRGGALDGFTNGNGILMLGGGYPLCFNGKICGGVGVSGGTKEQDMLLAKTGEQYYITRINRNS